MDSVIRPYEYFAFISYKREDEKWAKWLQKKLESYSLPTAIRKENPELPNKIRPVFRDQSEMSGGNLKAEIEKGLNDSKYLIVICSPRSAKSPWVSKEVQHFIDQGREEYIIPFIIGGTPNASAPEEECFPEGLRQLTGEKEILGININEMGRDAAAIKVIAKMFNLRFDSLWQRNQRIKKKIMIGWTFAAVITILISFIVAAIMITLKTEADRQAERAQLQTKIANKERDRVILTSKKLRIANDSIQKQADIIVQTNHDLAESIRQIAAERNNVLKANWKIMKESAKVIAGNAIQKIKDGNVYEAVYQLLELIPSHNEKPFIPELEYALRLAYDKLSEDGWVYVKTPLQVNNFTTTSDGKYLITGNYLSEGNGNVIIYDLLTMERKFQIDDKYFLVKAYDDLANPGVLLTTSDNKQYLFSILNNTYKYLGKSEATTDFDSLWARPDFGPDIVATAETLESSDEDPGGEAFQFTVHKNNSKATYSELVNCAYGITNYSLSPNRNLLALSYGTGGISVVDLINGKKIKTYLCPRYCDHYSNKYGFANDDLLYHYSRFDNLKILSLESMVVIDSIPNITGREIFGVNFCNNGNECWVSEECNLVYFEKRRMKNFNDLVSKDLIPVEFHKICEDTIIDKKYHIYNKDRDIICSERNTNNILWSRRSSSADLSDIVGFYDGKYIIIEEVERFEQNLFFIDLATGHEIYNISGFCNSYIDLLSNSYIFDFTCFKDMGLKTFPNLPDLIKQLRQLVYAKQNFFVVRAK